MSEKTNLPQPPTLRHSLLVVTSSHQVKMRQYFGKVNPRQKVHTLPLFLTLFFPITKKIKNTNITSPQPFLTFTFDVTFTPLLLYQ